MAEVVWDCDVLASDPEAKSAVEARALAELALVAPTGGVLDVRCSNHSATLSFQPRSGRAQHLSLELPAATPDMVDPLVDAVWQLGTAAKHAFETLPTPPKLARAAVARSPWRAFVWLGGDGALWPGAAHGWAGPAGGAGIAHSAGGRLFVGVGALFGFERVDGLALSSFDGNLLGDVTLLGQVTVGGGLRAGVVEARGDATLAPRARYSPLLALSLNPAWGIPLGSITLRVGPALECYVIRPSLALDGQQVFVLPLFSLGLAAQVSLGL